MASEKKSTDKDLPSCAYTIKQFCAIHGGISRAHYYELKRICRGPAEMKVGGRRLISIEAAEAWRRQMESNLPIPAKGKEKTPGYLGACGESINDDE